MIPRWLTPRLLLPACLLLDAALFAAWLLAARLGDSSPSWQPLGYATASAFAACCAVTLALLALLARRRAALAQSTEAKFHSLLDAAPDPILIMTGEGRVTLANARAERLFGCRRDELVGRPVDALLFQSERDDAGIDGSRSLCHSSGVPGGPASPELRAARKDGSSVPVELNFSPLETSDGLLTISIVRDISERKRHEALRNARHAARRILAEGASLQGAAPRLLAAVCETLRLEQGNLWLVDRPAAVLRLAHGWCGSSPSCVEAYKGLSFASGEGVPGRAWSANRPIRAGERGEPGLALPAPALQLGLRQGLAFPVAAGAEVLGVLEFFRRDAEPDETLAETLQNVAAQLSRFLKYRQAEDAVHESEARKAAILAAAVDAIVTIDHEGWVIEFNPAAERIFGHTRAEAFGRAMAQLLVPQAAQPAYEGLLGSCRQAGDGLWCATPLELSLTRADGSEVPVELVMTPIRTEGPPLVTCYMRDLSERKQAEEALRRAEDQLRQAQKLEAVGRLAGGVAHDFNNILTVMTGYTHILLNNLAADSPQRGSVESIAKAASRATSLTRQLLAFSRRQVLEPKVFDLNGAVADMTKMLQRLIGEHINLVTIPASDLKPIKADPGQIEQVLMNLVVNARDAMPRGGKITVETRNVYLDSQAIAAQPEVRPGQYVMLALSDTGTGMDAATKARIFEPFFTTKEVGQGTGLGLATVYGIIKQSGGHIAVYSEPNHGTTFKIYLPASEEKPSGAQAPAPAPPVQGGKGTVLLVEDEEMVRSLSTRILQQHGYTVREARHGLEALSLSEEELAAVDITVTDVVMPEMDGRDLAQRLLGRKPGMKVLYMSGYTDNAAIRSGLLEPGAAFLEKPFSPDSLTRKVHELLTA